MRFDKIIMNPPYSGNLHLKILAAASAMLACSGSCVNLSPSRWLQDPFKEEKANSDFNRFKTSVASKLEDLEIIAHEDTDKLFKINFGDLGIYVLSDEGGFDLAKLRKDSVIEKFKTRCTDSFMQHSTKEAYRGSYDSEFFGVVNSHFGDTTRWIKDDYKLFCTKRDTNTNKVIFFTSEQARLNCFKFLNLKSIRYYASVVRLNQRVPWQFLPWLGESVNPRTGLVGFESEWTDEDVYEFFGIDEEEQHRIELI